MCWCPLAHLTSPPISCFPLLCHLMQCVLLLIIFRDVPKIIFVRYGSICSISIFLVCCHKQLYHNCKVWLLLNIWILMFKESHSTWTVFSDLLMCLTDICLWCAMPDLLSRKQNAMSYMISNCAVVYWSILNFTCMKLSLRPTMCLCTFKASFGLKQNASFVILALSNIYFYFATKTFQSTK